MYVCMCMCVFVCMCVGRSWGLLICLLLFFFFFSRVRAAAHRARAEQDRRYSNGCARRLWPRSAITVTVVSCQPIYMYICICICICICIYIYVYIRTFNDSDDVRGSQSEFCIIFLPTHEQHARTPRHTHRQTHSGIRTRTHRHLDTRISEVCGSVKRDLFL